jgi:glycosyltransferase involved in cell wall biosynthesis
MSIVLPRLAAAGTGLRAVSARRTRAPGPAGWPGIHTSVLPVASLPLALQAAGDLVLVAWALLLGGGARLRRPSVRPTLLLVSPTMRGARLVAFAWSRLVGPVVARYPGSGGLVRARLAGNQRVRHVVLSPEQRDEAAVAGVTAELVDNAVEVGPDPPVAPPFRRFVVVGRLIATKRVDLVIRAWAAVADALPDWRLEVIGSGQGGRDDVEAELRRQARHVPRVELLGEVPDARAHLRGDAVVVHCSNLEGVPNTLLEAMAAGAPVIAETAALARWFGDPPPHVPWDGVSAASLAEVLLDGAGHDARLRAVARAAQEVAEGRWSPERITARWLEVLA